MVLSSFPGTNNGNTTSFLRYFETIFHTEPGWRPEGHGTDRVDKGDLSSGLRQCHLAHHMSCEPLLLSSCIWVLLCWENMCRSAWSLCAKPDRFVADLTRYAGNVWLYETGSPCGMLGCFNLRNQMAGYYFQQQTFYFDSLINIWNPFHNENTCISDLCMTYRLLGILPSSSSLFMTFCENLCKLGKALISLLWRCFWGSVGQCSPPQLLRLYSTNSNTPVVCRKYLICSHTLYCEGSLLCSHCVPQRPVFSLKALSFESCLILPLPEACHRLLTNSCGTSDTQTYCLVKLLGLFAFEWHRIVNLPVWSGFLRPSWFIAYFHKLW